MKDNEDNSHGGSRTRRTHHRKTAPCGSKLRAAAIGGDGTTDGRGSGLLGGVEHIREKRNVYGEELPSREMGVSSSGVSVVKTGWCQSRAWPTSAGTALEPPGVRTGLARVAGNHEGDEVHLLLMCFIHITKNKQTKKRYNGLKINK